MKPKRDWSVLPTKDMKTTERLGDFLKLFSLLPILCKYGCRSAPSCVIVRGAYESHVLSSHLIHPLTGIQQSLLYKVLNPSLVTVIASFKALRTSLSVKIHYGLARTLVIWPFLSAVVLIISFPSLFWFPSHKQAAVDFCPFDIFSNSICDNSLFLAFPPWLLNSPTTVSFLAFWKSHG